MQLTIFSNPTEERINYLRKEISKHDQLDALNKAQISDTEYDKLYHELVALEAQNPQLVVPTSPTQKITYIKKL